MKKLLLLITVFSATLLTAQNVPSYVPTNGLIGWWPFNGNANDESGNGNNGSVNGATLSGDRFGISNSAYSFDGVDDQITVSNSLSLNPNQITVSCWVKPLQFPSNGEQYIINKSYDPSPRHWSIRIDPNGRLAVETRINNTYHIYLASDSLDLNSWSSLVLLFDSTSTKLILNGSVILSQVDSGNLTTSTNDLSIGFFPHNSMPPYGYFWNGLIDDVGIWDRALDSLELHSLWNTCQDSIVNDPISNSFQTVPGIAHFTAAHSDTNATYQWQQNNGTGWSNLSDFGIYSGTSTDSLILTGITTSLNGYGYRCIIDACTLDTTDVAYLTVVDNVGIEESSKDLIVSPNPTSGLISINLTRTTMYNVYNMNGQKVAEGKTEGQIDLSNLPSGSYQLILFTQDGKKTSSLQKL